MLRAAAQGIGAAAWAAPSACGFLAAAARRLSAAAEPAHAGAHHGSSSSGSAHDEEPQMDLEVFRDTVREFAQEFVAPHAAEIDRLNAYPPG